MFPHTFEQVKAKAPRPWICPPQQWPVQQDMCSCVPSDSRCLCASLHTRGRRKQDNLVSSTAHPSAVLHLAALLCANSITYLGRLQTHQARSGAVDVGSCRIDRGDRKEGREKGTSHKKDANSDENETNPVVLHTGGRQSHTCWVCFEPVQILSVQTHRVGRWLNSGKLLRQKGRVRKPRLRN